MSSALSKFTAFFHRQFGSPSAELDQAVEGITEHVEQAIAARIEPLEKRIAELTGSTPVAADGADPFAEIRQEMADLRARFDAIEVLPAPDLEALHQRLAAVEAAATKAAPARAAAPAAKPAATTA